MQAFPCRCRLGDRESAGAVEDEVRYFALAYLRVLSHLF